MGAITRVRVSKMSLRATTNLMHVKHKYARVTHGITRDARTRVSRSYVWMVLYARFIQTIPIASGKIA